MSRPKWLVPVAIVVGLILVIVLPLIGVYNGLVNKEETVNQSFADLDAQLQRRSDLIPNLVNAVRAVLRQELDIFEEITDARAAYAGAPQDSPERVAAGSALESALGRLLVIVEDNPELRSNENVRDLQVQLEGTENRINQARRDYNGVITDYNVSIRRFPRSILAGMFGFDRKPLFEADEGARDNPEVQLELTPTPGG